MRLQHRIRVQRHAVLGFHHWKCEVLRPRLRPRVGRRPDDCHLPPSHQAQDFGVGALHRRDVSGAVVGVVVHHDDVVGRMGLTVQ